MSTEIAMKTNATLVLASKKDLERAIVQIAAVLPPKLSEDMPFKSWVKLIAETVGDHPVEVLNEARSVLLSTSGFAPSPKEFVDAVLAAYPRCKLPLSEDGKRHLSYRKNNSHRYITGEDGRQRFIDDAKLTNICFVSIVGVHANMVMDKMPKATVSDVEKALIATSGQFAKKDSATLSELIRAMEFHATAAETYRLHGRPEDYCGGTVAEVNAGYGNRLLTSPFLALSEGFVETLTTVHPKAFRQKHVLHTVFWEVVYSITKLSAPPGYGTTFQTTAEAAIHAAMRVKDGQEAQEEAIKLNRDWRLADHKKDVVARQKAEDEAFSLKKYVAAKGYDVKVYEKPASLEATP